MRFFAVSFAELGLYLTSEVVFAYFNIELMSQVCVCVCLCAYIYETGRKFPKYFKTYFTQHGVYKIFVPKFPFDMEFSCLLVVYFDSVNLSSF